MLGLLLTDFSQYWVLCEERFGREVTNARLQELAALEADCLAGALPPADQLRMHSPGLHAG